MTKKQRIGIEQESSKLRKQICEMFGATKPESVILAPGILIALQVTFARLGVRKLLMTSNEYYSPRHFPAAQVRVCDPERLAEEAERTRPDAVLCSLVTWRGGVQPAAEQFARIRRKFGRHSPLLITDYTHAGAIGFPSMRDLNADIVVGDLQKWISPPKTARYVAYLWIADGKLQKTLFATFRPFFLATADSEPLASRWVASWELKEALDFMADRKLNRKALLRQYACNLQLAEKVAQILGLKPPSNCIVWSAKFKKHPLLESLREHDLVWNTGEGYRIRCREEWIR